MMTPCFTRRMLICCLALAACAKSTHKWQKFIPNHWEHPIALQNGGTQKIELLYTGCGGMLVATGDEAILTDPFYTGQKVLKVPAIKINVNNVTKVMTSIDSIVPVKNIRSVLVAHSHYDHLHDLPYLLQNNFKQPVQVVGSSSAYCTVKQFMDAGDTYTNGDTLMYLQNGTHAINWVKVSPHMRVLLIQSGHAPHAGKHIHLMRGSTCKKGIKKLTKPTDKTNGFNWKEGTTYSFLIDVLDDAGKINLRLFMQSSSCDSALGFPPQKVLDEHKVDIAILGVASAINVKTYPGPLLNRLNPEKVILIHWEDFFRDMYTHVKTVRATNFKKFFRRLRRHYGYTASDQLYPQFVMPYPLTRITVNY